MSNTPERGGTCPYFPGDDDECPVHGEQAIYDAWMADPADPVIP